MNRQYWILLCVAGIAATVSIAGTAWLAWSYWHDKERTAAQEVQPLQKAVIPASTPGQPGWNPDGVAKTAANLLKKSDYAGLEQLAGEIKARGYDIRQVRPELRAFYDAFQLKGTDAENLWLDRQTQIDGWMRAHPESLTARIAMADWYIGYAWKARGTGWSDTVSQDGWREMHARLQKAAELLDAAQTVDDPEYYQLKITIAVDASDEKGEMGRLFEKGAALAPEYYPLYSNRAYFLLPRWFGEEGDREKFSRDCADALAGEKGDILYAELISAEATYDDGAVMKKLPFDYERARRGFLALAAMGKESNLWRSHLCRLAAISGDRETARRLFLKLGRDLDRSVFKGQNEREELWKAAGGEAEIAAALALERAGKFGEAEARWRLFDPGDDAENGWLKAFYMRQGMEEALRRCTRKTDGKTCAELLDCDLARANADMLGNLSRLAPQVGAWEKSEAAAAAFDQKRPWNLTGKTTLWLCALRRGDRARAEALRREVIAVRTDRPAYLAAQAVLKGETGGEAAVCTFKPLDIYNAQAVTAIALYYLTLGQPREARAALEAALPFCRETDDKRFVESMLWGSISRDAAVAGLDR